MNRSILKSNSSRQINISASQTKLSAIGNGIFKKTPSYDIKSTNNNEELLDRIRATKSDSIFQNKAHNTGSVSCVFIFFWVFFKYFHTTQIQKKSPDKSLKKVQFLDHISTDGQINKNEEEKEQFSHLLNIDNKEDVIDDYRNIFESVRDAKPPESQINENSDSLLTLLAAIPPEIADAHEDFFTTNNNFLSKLTTVELSIVGFSMVLFCIMIFKHFRIDWPLLPKSSTQPTASEILMLVGKNFKRMCKNVVPNMLSYFWNYQKIKLVLRHFLKHFHGFIISAVSIIQVTYFTLNKWFRSLFVSKR